MSEPNPTPMISVIVVPHDSAPKPLKPVDLNALKTELAKALSEGKEGYCYVHYNGQLCRLSNPLSVYKLKLPDGTEVMLGAETGVVYPEDYSFKTLVAYHSNS